MKFSSSLMLPGQGHRTSAFMVLLGTVSIFLSMRRDNFCTKCRTNSGMSSCLSRNGGIRIGKTFRR